MRSIFLSSSSVRNVILTFICLASTPNPNSSLTIRSRPRKLTLASRTYNSDFQFALITM
jgi:hypothetical protein